MAGLRLLNRLHTALIPCLCWLPAVSADPGADMARTNDAIEAWIVLIDSDRPFLRLDIGAGELRLEHGAALLRRCLIVAAVVDSHRAVAVSQRLQGRIRRYGAEPFQPISAGPFDWEQYLVQEADDECALWFDGGLLVYAHDAWLPAPAPAVRLAPEDLRALFDAVADSVGLVLLPAGWQTPSTAAQD